MADYGIKTSNGEVSVLDADRLETLMTTAFPFAKIDQTKQDTFRTTTVRFLNDVPDNTKTLIASFEHGYKYRPQVWGMWNVIWSASQGGAEQNGYGALTNSSGIPSSTLSYDWDEEKVYLYLEKGSTVGTPTNAIGTTATLTTYIFADDLQEATYT
jgi:hypothetical protein